MTQHQQPPDAEAPPAVEVRSITHRYSGSEAPALENVSLLVHPGERLGILGPNGGGKSTLLKLILGLLNAQSGSIKVFGKTPEEARRAGMIGYVPQRAEAELALPVSARQVVELGACWRESVWRRPSPDAIARTQRCIDLVGATAYADRPVGKLSGGQLQRVLIARALASNPRILALDEPTVGIDAAGQRRFAELLEHVHRETGVTMLIISHDLRAVAAGSDRVACLAQRLHLHTSPEGITPKVLAELFAHDLAGLSGTSLDGVHVHAHGPEEPCPEHTSVETSGRTAERGRA